MELTIDVDREMKIDIVKEKYDQYLKTNEKKALNFNLVTELVESIPELLQLISNYQDEVRILKAQIDEMFFNNRWMEDELNKSIQCLKEYE